MWDHPFQDSEIAVERFTVVQRKLFFANVSIRRPSLFALNSLYSRASQLANTVLALSLRGSINSRNAF